jgi:zinc transport system ATP-binding protein
MTAAREAAAMTPLLEGRGLGVAFGGQPVLDDVDIALYPREIVTIVGPNGSGKSTLLRLLIGATSPDAGTVTRAPGLRLGYVPQKLAVDRTLPITIGRFLSLAGGSPAERAEALEHVGIPGLADRQLSALSGGQFQRALLAQAILRRPQLLVLDEAAQGLDQAGEARFYQLVERLRGELGCGVLMVSHDLHVVMAASDRVICLNGHVCCEGTPTVVSAAPAYRALFGHGTSGALALYRHDHDHAHHHHDHHDHHRDHDDPAAPHGPPSGAAP